MLKITVNESESIEVRQEKDTWHLNGKPFDGSLTELSPRHFHIIWQGRSFNVEVIEHDSSQKTTLLRINGQEVATTAQDSLDLLLDSMGMKQAVTNRINEIKAPMPGLIQSVAVKAGDVVHKGDTLLVLVAMKMENTLKAPGEGTVKTIRTAPGTSVEKNQVLIEFE